MKEKTIYWVCPSCGCDKYDQPEDWKKRCQECGYIEDNEPKWKELTDETN